MAAANKVNIEAYELRNVKNPITLTNVSLKLIMPELQYE